VKGEEFRRREEKAAGVTSMYGRAPSSGIRRFNIARTLIKSPVNAQ